MAPLDRRVAGGFAPRRHVSGEGIEFGRRGRQSGEIETRATQPRFRRGHGGGRQPFAFQSRQHKPVERMARPGGAAHGGRRCLPRRLEGPVLLIHRALGHPAADERDLFRSNVLVAVLRRHLLVGILGREAEEEFTVGGLSRHDHRIAVAVAGDALPVVEPQFGFAAMGILPVATQAVLREDRPDIAVKFELLRGRSETRMRKQQRGKDTGGE